MSDTQEHERLPVDEKAAEAYVARREALQTAVIALNAELDELAAADEPDHDRFVTAVRDLRDALEAHVREAESDDGLLAQIMQDASWFSARVQALRDEHAEFVERADALLDEAASGASLDGLLLEARKLSAKVTKHRHKGTTLLQDAYMLDIPAGD